MDEVQESIHMIRPGWRATVVRLAISMVMPMDHLDKLKGVLEYTDPESWMNELDKMVWLMGQFFQKSMESYEHDFLARADNIPSKSRDPEEEKVCLETERNVCLATGMGLPGACHIVPFAFDADDADAIATRAMVLGSCKFLGDSRAVCDLLGQHPGSSDKAWDMLTPERSCAEVVKHGIFRFQVSWGGPGDSLATIQLQLHWMARPSNNPNPYREVDLEDREAVYQGIAHLSKTPSKTSSKGRGFIGIPRAESGTAVISGDLLEIRMPYNEALKMKSMIDLQWTMISCLALSGAAGSPELLYASLMMTFLRPRMRRKILESHAHQANLESCRTSPPAHTLVAPSIRHRSTRMIRPLISRLHWDRPGSMCLPLHDHPCRLKVVERGYPLGYRVSVFDVNGEDL